MTVAAKRREGSAECPICRHKFATGTTGWYSHIGRLANHPNWHPDVKDPNERKTIFMREYPEFFKDAWTPSRRHPTTDVPAHAVVPSPPATRPLHYCPNCGIDLTIYSTPTDGSR